MYITSPTTRHNRNMMKNFTPPRLHFLDPASDGLGLSIILKCVKSCVYNAQIFLQLAPMSLECPKMATYPLSAPNFVEN